MFLNPPQCYAFGDAAPKIEMLTGISRLRSQQGFTITAS